MDGQRYFCPSALLMFLMAIISFILYLHNKKPHKKCNNYPKKFSDCKFPIIY